MARLQLSSPRNPLAFAALTSGCRHLRGSQLVTGTLGPHSGSPSVGARAPGALGAAHLPSPALPLFSLSFLFWGTRVWTM